MMPEPDPVAHRDLAAVIAQQATAIADGRASSASAQDLLSKAPMLASWTSPGPLTVAGLADLMAGGYQPQFLYFWQPPDSSCLGLDASCLSQWYRASFTVNSEWYPTAEHYMMTMKAGTFGDLGTARRIRNAPHPRDARSLGRKITPFDEAIWARNRVQVVTRGNLAKFSQNLSLREYLLSTGDKVLVEASPHDPVWGIGLAAGHPQAADPRRWRGLNLLGFILMDVRTQLQTSSRL